jgi:hypothetical protein
LLYLSGAALAGPGFIASSNIRSGSSVSEVSLVFKCDVQYIGHDPDGEGDQLRIQLESTGVCVGVSPEIARSREQYRPAAADDAKIVSIEYDGESFRDPLLRFNFSEEVRFELRPALGNNSITVRIYPKTVAASLSPSSSSTGARRVQRTDPARRPFVINLESSQRRPTSADLPVLSLTSGQTLFVTEAQIDGATWYRTRLGHFSTAEEAQASLANIKGRFPAAWIDRAASNPRAVEDLLPLPPGPGDIELEPAPDVQPVRPGSDAVASGAAPGNNKTASLMVDARRAMTGGEISRAVQIYTKVLQMPASDHHPEAQEFLALARERNGQIAHAKAEYQRYLSVYPEGDGTARVQQRLAALVSSSTGRQPGTMPTGDAASGRQANRPGKADNWKIRTFFSQYYRRDVNQFNDEDEIVSQSSLYSDLNLDARYRGERFDFSTRLTAGYRYNLLDDGTESDNDVRFSYGYADLVDTRLGLRGRLGRQTKNTGGVLGRFDGLNLSYSITDRLRLETVAGRPVYSTADSVDDARTFYGVSTNFGPIGDNLDAGMFFLQQDIEGMVDRQSVGAELRYFGETKSLWGIVNFDTAFSELASVFLQGSWRLPSQLTLTGLVDSRRSPFLSSGNAMIGRESQDFNDLLAIFTEDDIRQLALDRSPNTTTLTLGLSRPLSPKLQFNISASQTGVDATPESGRVLATEDTTYSYYSTDLVASSLFREGDVGILGLRYSDSNATQVISLNLDTRFPFGRAFRISPRLRIDHRLVKADDSTQWIYTPGLRMQYRWGRKLRLEFEAGKQYSIRELELRNEDRESYFVNLGYQFFY